MKHQKLVALLLLLSLGLTLLCGCSGEKKESGGAASAASPADGQGKVIGVVTGTIFDTMVKEKLPDSTVVYFTASPDLPVALRSGKIDAYVEDMPSAKLMLREYPEQAIVATLETDASGFIFSKNDPKAETLCRQMNEFLPKIKGDGTLDEINSIWTGSDTSRQDVDTEGLTDENGTLSFATEGTYPPFSYVSNGKAVGYDVDIAVRFCREYGYGIDISLMSFDGVLAAVSAGKADFGGSGISITEERKESLLFSEPDFVGGIVLVASDDMGIQPEETTEEAAEEPAEAQPEYCHSLEDLRGKLVGTQTGSDFDLAIMEYIPGSTIEYFNTTPDLPYALQSGKIDAYVTDHPVAVSLLRDYPDQTIIAKPEEDRYAFVFRKDDPASEALCQQFNTFLAKLRAEGTLDEINALWFGPKAPEQAVDLSSLTGENGTLSLATEAAFPPFSFMTNGQIGGYEIDIAARFCREYGYGLDITEIAFDGLLAAMNTGKCDFAAAGICISEEREDEFLFSDPDYFGGVAVVVRKDPDSAASAADPALRALQGKTVGVLSGSIHDVIAEKAIPDCQVTYFNAVSDLPLALESGKIHAYLDGEPSAKLLMQEYPSHGVLSRLQDEEYGFIFPKDDPEARTLCQQMNEYLAKITADGTLAALDAVWFGTDESLKVVDYSFTGENGTLTLVTDPSLVPFSYIINGQIGGYEIDLAARFCREYGYALEVSSVSFSGLLASVSAGKADFGAAGITVTEERKEALLFSDPDYAGGIVAVVKNDADSADAAADPALDDLQGKTIGVLSGSIHDTIAGDFIPGCRVEYYNAITDLPLALENGKIDAYLNEEPMARTILRDYPSQSIVATLRDDSYGFLFRKDVPKGKKLQGQMNAFLAKIKADGTLAEIDTIWFGGDEALKKVDYSFTGKNGTLLFGTDPTLPPFSYMIDGEFGGYDVDIAARFCREYGYKLEIVSGAFSGLMAGLTAGKLDFVGDCITITEERKQSFLFSDPDYTGGIVVVGPKADDSTKRYRSLEELQGKVIAVKTGGIADKIAESMIPGCKVEYFQQIADMAFAVDSGKAEGYMTDEPVARALIGEYPTHEILSIMKEDHYGFIFRQSPEGEKLQKQMNEFLAKIKADGTLKEIDSIWLGTDKSLQHVDMDSLTGENGTLTLATEGANPPFNLMINGELGGYEVDIAARFCKEYGYGLQIELTPFSGLLAAISSGKADFGASGLSITEERKKSVLFSDPDYDGGIVMVVKNVVNEPEETADSGKLAGIAESFRKTFIREDRWKLFAQGIKVTLVVTLLSALLGTILGFLLFLVYRKEYKVFNKLLDLLMDVLSKSPVVVVLMVLYYIIFGNSELSGLGVSVVAFSVLFACSFIGIVKVGVSAVDPGQVEASLALGFSDTKTFIHVTLPQAARVFLPSYKGNIVSLMKDTAVVGYITVQDLTKVSDIVRSRTYEAFFPLIATALIYFVLAWVLTVAVRRLEIDLDPTRRSVDKILKGVKRK